MPHAPPRVESEQARPTAPKPRKPRATARTYAPEVACDLPDGIPVSAGELGLVLAYLHATTRHAACRRDVPRAQARRSPPTARRSGRSDRTGGVGSASGVVHRGNTP